uniref:Toll-like receptor 2 n=1 Tax=Sphenodon punctatus TaxID=8508 RepID=A0A8D0HAZ7_SPHPU
MLHMSSYWLLLVMYPYRTGCTLIMSCYAIHFCDCSAMGLHAVPSVLTNDITGLNLAYNHIEHVTETDFRLGVSLRKLMLQSNGIQTVDESAFHLLRKLEHLDLSNNNLTRLSSAWFRSLSALQRLNISGNKYKTLGRNPLFSNLKNLRYLHLGNDDCFSSIQKHDFEGISVLKELVVEVQSLRHYEQGSLKAIENISHIIISHTDVLSVITEDLANSTVCFELRNTDLSSVNRISALNFVVQSLIKKVVFKNVSLTDESVSKLIKILRNTEKLLNLELENCELRGTGYWDIPKLEGTIPGSLETLTIERLRITKFHLFSSLQGVEEFVTRLKKVTVGSSKVFLVPCVLAQHFYSLEYLDLHDNLFVNQNFVNSTCNEAWPLLQTLNLSKNSLKSLEETGKSLIKITTLANLDISQNNFVDIPESCQWPENLKYLNLSDSKIPRLTSCLPQTLEILDVSGNNLEDFGLKLPLLKELYIGNNKLKTLPDAGLIPAIRVLRISRNKLNSFSEGQLESFRKMEILDASENNFICSCEFLSFIQSQQGKAFLAGWPESYICDSPSSVREKQVGAARLSLTECHRTLVVCLSCILMFLVILVTVILCYKLHVIWYMKMTWAWLQAKRKPPKAHNKDICYDAFVSYSERDSEWVENLLVQELEQAIPPFKLCLHKRDFVPGKWIVDNIIDSIEKSHKTLFVLSDHFVQSEWCKYELDFSHFRLFDENSDTAILILLEPIQEKTIPKRFCKLRKIMNTRTYLEWPLDEEQQQLFWNNLKIALAE